MSIFLPLYFPFVAAPSKAPKRFVAIKPFELVILDQINDP